MQKRRLSAKRTKPPETRRAELIASAEKVFAKKGVADATVSDIVKAAGVAQGTFYLYFKTKADILSALVEQMVDMFVAEVEASISEPNADAEAKFLALRDSFLSLAHDAPGRKLAPLYRQPKNRAFHDRVRQRLTIRLAPIVETLVKQGIDEGVFTTKDPCLSAWFVLGGLQMLKESVVEPTDLPAAIENATVCALGALGHVPPITPTTRTRT